MSFSLYELRLIEIKERGIMVTAKAYSKASKEIKYANE